MTTEKQTARNKHLGSKHHKQGSENETPTKKSKTRNEMSRSVGNTTCNNNTNTKKHQPGDRYEEEARSEKHEVRHSERETTLKTRRSWKPRRKPNR